MSSFNNKIGNMDRIFNRMIRFINNLKNDDGSNMAILLDEMCKIEQERQNARDEWEVLDEVILLANEVLAALEAMEEEAKL